MYSMNGDNIYLSPQARAHHAGVSGDKGHPVLIFILYDEGSGKLPQVDSSSSLLQVSISHLKKNSIRFENTMRFY